MLQLKPNPPYGLYVFLTRICLGQLFTDVADMDIDGIVLAVIAALPDLLVQIFPGIYFVRIMDEQKQNIKFMAGQGDLPPLYHNLAGLRVNGQVPDGIRLRFLPVPSSSLASVPENACSGQYPLFFKIRQSRRLMSASSSTIKMRGISLVSCIVVSSWSRKIESLAVILYFC